MGADEACVAVLAGKFAELRPHLGERAWRLYLGSEARAYAAGQGCGLAAAGTRYLASDTTGIVCFPSCRNARRITPAHRRGFASLAVAGRSGFRPCLHCQP